VRFVSRARAEELELAAFGAESGPPDFVGTVRAPEWEDWLRGEAGSGGPGARASDPRRVSGEAAWWSRAKLARKVEAGSIRTARQAGTVQASIAATTSSTGALTSRT